MELCRGVTVLQRENLQWINGHLVGDVSDQPGFVIGRLFPDACDEGVAIPRLDGRLAPFVLTKRETNGEGELCAWHFTSLDGTYKLTIFND